MSTGLVTTARGGTLNMDDLIMQGQRAVGRAAKSTKETARYVPEKSNETQLRGFVPAAGAVPVPSADTDDTVATTPKKHKVAAANADDKEATSVNDLTSVTVKASAATKARAKAAAKVDKSVDDDEALGDMLKELDQPTKK